MCPEADKAKGREGLSWHEALATFGPKKVLFSQFFTRLWGVLGSQKLHLVKLSYCSKGKAGGEMFSAELSPGERKEQREWGHPELSFQSSLSSPWLQKPRKSLGTAAVTGNLPSGTGSSKQTLHHHCVRYNPEFNFH